MITKISSGLLHTLHERGYLLLQEINRTLGVSMDQVYDLMKNLPHLAIDTMGNIIPPENFGKGRGYLVVHVTDLVIGFPGYSPESLAEKFGVPLAEKTEDPFVSQLVSKEDILCNLENIDYTRLAVVALNQSSLSSSATMPARIKKEEAISVPKPLPKTPQKSGTSVTQKKDDIVLFTKAKTELSDFLFRHGISVRTFQAKFWPTSKKHLSNMYHILRGDFRSKITRDEILRLLLDPKTELLFAENQAPGEIEVLAETEIEASPQIKIPLPSTPTTPIPISTQSKDCSVRLVFGEDHVRVEDPHGKIRIAGIEISGDMILRAGVSLHVTETNGDLFLHVIPAGV